MSYSTIASILCFSLSILVGLYIIWEIRKATNSNPAIPSSVISKSILIVFGWIGLSGFLGYFGLFENFNSFPPKVILNMIIPIIGLIFLARNTTFQLIIKQIPYRRLILAQGFRIPVEFFLWFLFLDQVIPVQMTFEGYNFDILAGIFGVIVGGILYKKGTNKSLILIWNIVSLLLLLNIVTIAILSIPSPFRQFINEPSNTIIGFFPFNWLPGVLVMFALYAHISIFIKLKK